MQRWDGTDVSGARPLWFWCGPDWTWRTTSCSNCFIAVELETLKASGSLDQRGRNVAVKLADAVR